MHSTLLIGNYDWDAERMPKGEFEERIRTFWKRMPESCAGLAVYGDRRHNAELVYFGHVVPKLRDALVLIPRQGEPRMLIAGGGESQRPAVRQTWIAKLESLSDLPKAVAEWQQALGASVAVLGTDGVRLSVQQDLAKTLGTDDASKQAAEVVRAMMQEKSVRELAEVRRGCAMLKSAAAALQEGMRAGKGVTDCVIQAEHEAVKLHAMEVRSLFSLDGGKTLRPFTTPLKQNVNPLQAYIAVRSGGYWVDAHLRAGEPGEAGGKAAEALKKVIGAMKPGAGSVELARIAKEAVAPCTEHPLTRGGVGNSVGLALDDEPKLAADRDQKLLPGGIYSIRVGATDGKDSHAIVSAIVAVTARGNEVLFSS